MKAKFKFKNERQTFHDLNKEIVEDMYFNQKISLEKIRISLNTSRMTISNSIGRIVEERISRATLTEIQHKKQMEWLEQNQQYISPDFILLTENPQIKNASQKLN